MGVVMFDNYAGPRLVIWNKVCSGVVRTVMRNLKWSRNSMGNTFL